MNYRQDHIKIIEFLAKDLPKRNSYKVSDIAKVFTDVSKRKPDTALNPDRATRNALRKPRKEGHIEIAERGEYRLTPQGANFFKKLGAYDVAPDRKGEEKVTKRAKAGKVEKKAAKADKRSAKAEKIEKKSAKVSKLEKNKTKLEKKAKTSVVEEKAEKKKKKGGGLRLPKSKKPENVVEDPVVDDESIDLAEDDVDDGDSDRRSVGSELSI